MSLGPLSAAEVHRVGRRRLGGHRRPELVRALMASTAGLPFLRASGVTAAARAGGDLRRTPPSRRRRFALIERLRRVDEPVLDTLLVSSLSPELGPDDVAAALRVGSDEAQRLVDRARASGLIAPVAQPRVLRARCTTASPQIIGAARHHDVEIALLRSQIEMSTLSTDLALRLAEHGLRDARLADALTDLAAAHRDQPDQGGPAVPRGHRGGRDARSAHDSADALALTGRLRDGRPAGRRTARLRRRGASGRRRCGSRRASPCTTAARRRRPSCSGGSARTRTPYVGAASAVVSIAAGDVAGRTGRAERRQCRSADVDRARGTQPRRGTVADPRRALSRPRSPGWPSRSRPSSTDPASRRTPPPRWSRWRRCTAATRSAPAASSAARSAQAATDDGLRRAPAPAAARLGAHAGRPARRGRRRRRRRAVRRRCTAATRCGRRRCRPRSRGAAVTAARCRSTGTPRWRCSPSTRWTCSRCCRSASCGWPPRGCARSTGSSTRSTRRSTCSSALGNPVLWSVPLHWAGVHAGILANSPEAVAPHGQALTAAAADSAFAKALAGRGPHLAAGAGQPRRRRRGDRGGTVAVAVRTHLGCHPAGQPGRAADPGRPGVGGDAAVGPRPQARPTAVDDGRRVAAPSTARRPRVRRGRSHRGCRTESARSPNCCCRACRTAISAASCSSRRRPSSTTSRASGAGSGRSRARRCCRCCGRCWPRRADRPTSSPNAPRSPNRIPLSVTPRHRGEHRSATPTCALVSKQSFRDQTDAEV